MSKIASNKLKQSSKRQHKPMKVAISFNKKNKDESPEKNDHVSEEMIKIPVGKQFVPPKHSSTPKPKRNSNTKQVSPSDVLCIQPKFQMKECYVLVERLEKNDLPSKVSNLKATASSISKKQKHQQKKTTKINPSKSDSVLPQNLPVENGRKEHPSNNGELYVTTIPSEALKSFGLLTDVPESLSTQTRGSSLHSNTSVVIETPPRTSTACSSVDCSLAHNESCNGIIEDDAELPTAASRLVESSAPILFQSNNAEDAAPLNASSVSQPDPLEMGPQDTSLKTRSPPVNVHCDYLYGLNERMNRKPDIINLNELDFSNPDVRLVAPYALRLDTSRDEFFLYAAAISKKREKFCCLIFGVLDHYLIAYSGHFLVDKDQLYDPINKVPVNEVKLSDFNLCRQHLVLFNVPNKMFLEMEGYFLQASHSSYCETQFASFEMLMFSINQVQLKEKVRGDIALEKIKAQIKTSPQFKDFEFGESSVQSVVPGSHRVISAISKPRTEHVFFETCLPINKDSIERILHNVKPVGCVKTQYNHLGSLQLKCATEEEFFTMFYAAYEEPGCTAFYRNVFLLGYVDGHYIVGVVADQIFFVMATKRLYSRNSLPSPGMQPIKFSPQMLEMIDFPLWLPYEYVLTMLEIRQVLRHSREYACDFKRVVESFGILDLERPSSNLFNYSGLRSREKHYAWLIHMLNLCYSPTFHNTLNEFPVNPTSWKNALFSEIVTKLWIHELLREIRKSNSPKTCSAHDEFELIPELHIAIFEIYTFIAKFLPLFGLSVDSKFQCQLLGPDGVPSAVCSENLSAGQIGTHVYHHHILPLSWDENPNKNFLFSPFSLIYESHNPALGDKCDLESLRRNLVDSWPKSRDLPTPLENVDEGQLDNGIPVIRNGRKMKRPVESQSLKQKRRLASEECTSSSPKRGRRSILDMSSSNSD